MKFSTTLTVLGLTAGLGLSLEQCENTPDTPQKPAAVTHLTGESHTRVINVLEQNSQEAGPRTEEEFTARAPVLKGALERKNSPWEIVEKNDSSHLVYQAKNENRITVVSLPNADDILADTNFNLLVETFESVTNKGEETHLERLDIQVLRGDSLEDTIAQVEGIMDKPIEDFSNR